MGPEAFGSSEVVPPLMIILLMEVVMVSTYVRPVASSLTIQLELTLEIPGVITSPTDRVPMGTSWSNSTSSRVHKQAITPTKLHGGVGGLTSANAPTGGGGSGGEGVSNRQIRDTTGIVCDTWCDLALHLEVWVGCSISLVVTTGRDGCNTFPHPMNFGDLSWGHSSGTRVVWGASVGEGIVELPPSSASGMATPRKTSSLVKVKYHYTSSLSSHTLSAKRWHPPPVGGSFCSTQY